MLDVQSITEDDCILFMWTTGPQMSNSIELGEAWGFEYKTVAFVWDKQVHNPGRYTLSQTEFVLAFKKGKFPTPRGARNVRQLVSVHRGEHSEKPEIVIDGITKMFPEQNKIELFARRNYFGWDNWGLEIPDEKIEILSQHIDYLDSKLDNFTKEDTTANEVRRLSNIVSKLELRLDIDGREFTRTAIAPNQDELDDYNTTRNMKLKY